MCVCKCESECLMCACVYICICVLDPDGECPKGGGKKGRGCPESLIEVAIMFMSRLC